MKILELFCGTKSIGKNFPEANIISIDILKRFNPTICRNIMDIDYKNEWNIGEFDYIHASPPCNDYSKCNNGNPNKVFDYEYYDGLVQRAIDIIEYLDPKYYTIENPQTGTLKNRNVILDWDKGNNFFDIDYCRFGYNYRKRTRFWSNINFPNTLCLGINKCTGMINRKHKISIGNGNKIYGDKVPTLFEKYSIPNKFILELKSFIY
jgi:site-specific DNA-cytosine methylase